MNNTFTNECSDAIDLPERCSSSAETGIVGGAALARRLFVALQPDLSLLFDLDRYPSCPELVVQVERIDGNIYLESGPILETNCSTDDIEVEAWIPSFYAGGGWSHCLSAHTDAEAEIQNVIKGLGYDGDDVVLNLKGDIFSLYMQSSNSGVAYGCEDARGVYHPPLTFHVCLLEAELQRASEDTEAAEFNLVSESNVFAPSQYGYGGPQGSGSGDVSRLIARYRSQAARLLQLREHLSSRRAANVRRSVSRKSLPREGVAGGTYLIKNGCLALVDADSGCQPNSHDDDDFVTLHTEDGSRLTAYPGASAGSGNARIDRLRGVFADRTHVDIDLNNKVESDLHALNGMIVQLFFSFI
jgi:hypothetical protein